MIDVPYVPFSDMLITNMRTGLWKISSYSLKRKLLLARRVRNEKLKISAINNSSENSQYSERREK